MSDHHHAAPDRENVKRIADRIYDVLGPDDGGDVNITDALEALTKAFVFVMSQACPECRENIAHELQRRVPDMLHEADAFAAYMADQPSPAAPMN